MKLIDEIKKREVQNLLEKMVI